MAETIMQNIKKTIVLILSALLLAGCAVTESTKKNMEDNAMEKLFKEEPISKTKVINITDLIADPDDEQSLVRMFVTCNQVDLKGVIVSTSCWRPIQDQDGMNRLLPIIDAYGEVLSNLKVHADGYPSLEYIQSIAVMGQTGYSMDDVGEGKDSDGSELIISVVDEDDRPTWINLWGGANTVAQALWKVKNTRSEAEVNEFVSKLRIYDVLGQDEAGAWIVTTFPDIMYIRSTLIGGFGGSEDMKGDDYRNKIRSYGALGALYPLRTYGAFEGDSPSFMYQIPTGMNDPEHIDWGSWGGAFSTEKKSFIRGMSAVKNEKDYDPYYMYGDCDEKDESTSRWAIAYQNDFLARMIRTVTEKYENANHHPVAVLNGDTTMNILEMNADAGKTVKLSAKGSSDPDGNNLSYNWYVYNVPGSYYSDVTIKGSDSEKATIVIPDDAKGKSIHVILEIHDDGSPELYAYRRMIINVQ